MMTDIFCIRGGKGRTMVWGEKITPEGRGGHQLECCDERLAWKNKRETGEETIKL